MSPEPARNAPCPCGSGRKYKRCCGAGGRGASVAASADKVEQIFRFYQQGNFQAASHLAEQLLRQQPNDATLVEAAAVSALQLGHVEHAVDRFNRLLQLQPDNARTHSNLCLALHLLGRDEAAFEHGQNAIRLDPKLADAWNNLGNIYKTGNHLEGAREHYERALSLNAGDPRVHVNAGTASQLLGDLETAERRYRDALALHDGFAPAWNNLGAVLQKQGRYDESAQAYRKALKLEPANPETLNNYGVLLFERGEIEAARELFEQAIAADPDYVGAYASLGNLHDRLQEQEAVTRYYDKALLLDPDNTTVHCNLGYRCFELGHQKEAVEHFIHALKTDPNSAKALAGLGKAMLRQDDMDRAVEYIGKALQLAPRDIHVHMARALLDTRQRNLDSAEAEWKYVIEQQPGMSDGYIGLATHYAELGDQEAARAQYHAAEANQAVSPRLYHTWSGQEEKVHNLDEAERLAHKALELNPSYAGLSILRARLARRRKDLTGALEILQEIDPATIENNLIKAGYLFELGNVLDKLGRYDEAFTAYDAANQAKNGYIGRIYDPEEDRQKFSRWKTFFTPDNWHRLEKLSRPADIKGAQPVFIVGFPRSGTSLLEQILGSHPLISPAGELDSITDLANYKAGEITGSNLPYPELLLDAAAPHDGHKLAALRDYYLSHLAALGVTDGNSRWVTDKLPHNAIHLGLIALLFPRSPIIHISRHPLNSCLSAYFSNFFSAHRYTSSLESTARHYGQVMEMLEHYRSIGIHFLEVHYEDLVTDQEQVTRRIFDYIGAPWDDACLQHHKSARIVKTASYEQVTQKIYTSSLYRYRNYREAVQPIIPILASTIARFGYTTD